MKRKLSCCSRVSLLFVCVALLLISAAVSVPSQATLFNSYLDALHLAMLKHVDECPDCESCPDRETLAELVKLDRISEQAMPQDSFRHFVFGSALSVRRSTFENARKESLVYLVIGLWGTAWAVNDIVISGCPSAEMPKVVVPEIRPLTEEELTDAIVVELPANAVMMMGGDEVTLEEVEERVRAALQQGDRPIVIRVSRKTFYRKVLDLKEVIRKAAGEDHRLIIVTLPAESDGSQDEGREGTESNGK